MSVSKSFNHLSASVSLKEVEEKAPMKQGIVTILGSDCERSRAASIRRTLSADMSSKKWLAQNGFFSPVKKITSSEELVVNTDGDSSSSEQCEKNPGQDDVWRSIQSQKGMQKPAKLDVWGTILTQKSENPATSDLLPPPYVHPLVRRSASSLSEKSLEICTESLGSESGSDGFSSYPSSEILSDGDDDEEERQRVALQDDIEVANPFEDLHVVKYKSSPVRPFPPPLTSISGGDGASLHIHSHRKNGTLVLEAIAVPTRKHFHAQRANGRLILTLINSLDSQEKKTEEFEEMFDNMEEVDASIEEEKVEGGGEDDNEEEEVVVVVEEEKFNVNNGAKAVEFFMEQNSKSLPSGMINVQKSSLMMKKLMGLDKKNPTWSPSHKFNKAVNSMEAEEVVAEQEAVKELPIPQSLPLRPPAWLIPSLTPPVASAFNAYEPFWRSHGSGHINPMMTTQQPTLLKSNKFNGGNVRFLANNNLSNKLPDITTEKAYTHQETAPTSLTGNKTDHCVPYLRGCNKEPRSSSLLICEPYCIATS